VTIALYLTAGLGDDGVCLVACAIPPPPAWRLAREKDIIKIDI
jgi:hypothetical protein